MVSVGPSTGAREIEEVCRIGGRLAVTQQNREKNEVDGFREHASPEEVPDGLVACPDCRGTVRIGAYHSCPAVTSDYAVRDWVRFYACGRPVVGEVLYMVRRHGRTYLCTDVGEIGEEFVLERRGP